MKALKGKKDDYLKKVQKMGRKKLQMHHLCCFSGFIKFKANTKDEQMLEHR